tara:strand:+ start:867 stop:1139 length:273 start_codon:yes stop_codon:yes gene_type:complete
MDGGAFEGGVDGFQPMSLLPGDSVWDELGLYRLKKCPFCGEPPDWSFVNDEHGGFEWLVHCKEKTCHVKPETSWTDESEFAALKWNRRFR